MLCANPVLICLDLLERSVDPQAHIGIGGGPCRPERRPPDEDGDGLLAVIIIRESFDSMRPVLSHVSPLLSTSASRLGNR